MGRYVKQNDKDYMKMAMLKQEETFRQQVHELHRLYGVQKLLMNNMKTEVKMQKELSNTQKRPQGLFNLKLSEQEYTENDDIEEESDLELTLAIGSNTRQRKKESSFTSDSSLSSSSIENGIGYGSYKVSDVKKINVSGQIGEGKMKQPPWLFECLSMKNDVISWL